STTPQDTRGTHAGHTRDTSREKELRDVKRREKKRRYGNKSDNSGSSEATGANTRAQERTHAHRSEHTRTGARAGTVFTDTFLSSLSGAVPSARCPPWSDMLCPRFHSPLTDPMWPLARSLWPETRPLLYSIEQDVLRHLEEMRHNMEYMERLHQRIFEQIDQALPSPGSTFRPVAVENLAKDNVGAFALSLDTSEFSPDELSVKQVSRKLRVSGKNEKKQDDGKGSYSYRCQEFRQEF
ncbi:hypothetical protein NQD34_010062, partial [Periophthalmus magnuspinnatus]